jgi:hypothetical protein
LPLAAFILGLTQHGPGGSFASGKKLGTTTCTGPGATA